MSSTVPARRADFDFEYGDAFEALAAGTSLMNAISTYCVVCSVVACELRIESPDCDLLTYQPANALRALTSYGVSGILALDQESPFLAIPFCSAVDKSFLFSPLASSGDSGVFLWDAAYSQVIAAVPAVRDAVMDSAEPCPASSNRRLSPEPVAGDLPRRGLGHTPQRALPAAQGSAAEARPQLHSDSPDQDLCRDESISEPSGARRSAGASARRVSAGAGNPLGLRLAAVGVDDGGFQPEWGPYQDGSAAPFWVDGNASEHPVAALALYRYAGPTYAAVDLSNPGGLRVGLSLDGAQPACGAAPPAGAAQTCRFSQSGGGQATLAARVVAYGNTTRVVVYATAPAGPSSEPEALAAAAALAAAVVQGAAPPAAANGTAPGACAGLTVWLCGNGTAAQDASFLNLTDALAAVNKRQLTGNSWDNASETLGPLEPGPFVGVDVLVGAPPDAAGLRDLQLRLCGVVWNLSAVGDERCEWQIWADVSAGARAVVWDDKLGWIPAAHAQQGVWTVSVTALLESNARASNARAQLTAEINSDSFKAAFSVLPNPRVTASGESGARFGFKQYFAYAVAPRPAAKRGTGSPFGCISHYECQGGQYCSTSNRKSQNGPTATYLGGAPAGSGGVCDDCWRCLDASSPMDGVCPEDRCGPRAGLYPKCWDAQRLLRGFTCKDTYALNIGGSPSQVQGAGKALPAAAQPVRLRARFITPFNRLVGAVIIRQQRVRRDSSAIPCGLHNDSVARYSLTADPGASGPICVSAQQDATVYGLDPAFTPSSSLYDGTLNPFDFYNASEIADPTTNTPYGFFPHAYDWGTQGPKTTTLVPSEAENFLVYLDERVSSVKAQKMITYLGDGNFFDEQTSKVTVEMNTINAGEQCFQKIWLSFTFQVIRRTAGGRCRRDRFRFRPAPLLPDPWERVFRQTGGSILWDYSISSVPMYTYQSKLTYVLQLLCIVFMAVNAFTELAGAPKRCSLPCARASGAVPILTRPSGAPPSQTW